MIVAIHCEKCVKLQPECLCTHCENDAFDRDGWKNCCTKMEHCDPGSCPMKECKDFTEEQKDV